MTADNLQYEIAIPEQLTDGDWNELIEVTHKAYEEHARRGLTILSVSCSLDFLKRRCMGNKLILVRHGERIVAYYCYAILTQPNNKKALKTVTLTVHPEYKRMGISCKLHDTALEQARLLQCAYGFLNTSCDAPSARAAHRAAGFRDWYFTHFPNANHYSIVMRIDLHETLSPIQRFKALAGSWLKIHIKMGKKGQARLPLRIFNKIRRTFQQKCNLPIASKGNLRPLSLSETQQINLSILQFFSDFCNKHGLRYLLCYGTLIGAIRHKGFIPWDDDVDVTMPIPDYYKFRELIEKENPHPHYKVLYGMKMNVGIPYTMLGDMRTLAEMPGRDKGHSRPVAIDILPCYALSDDDESAKTQIQSIANLTSESWWYLYFRHSSRTVRLLHRWFITRNKLSSLLRKIEKITNQHPWGSTKRVRTMAFVHTAFTWLTPHDFDDYLLHPFEDSTFRIPRSYHEHLASLYGNYMELPPPHKRVANYSNAYIDRKRDKLSPCP